MLGKINVDNATLEFIKNFEYRQSGDIHFTSIILLTYNKLDYTKLCIESIRKFTPSDKYEIIVVDNNSNDGTQNWLEKQNDIKVIYNDKNEGFPKGCNQGIEISKGESILLLNNDTIVTPNWLNNLDKALYTDIKNGAVGAITNSCSNHQAINVTYSNIEELIDFSASINNNYDDNLHELFIRLIGYCLLIKREVLETTGLLDEIFTPGNFEDDDLSFRILKSGYYLLLCKDTFIHHFGSTSFKENEVNYTNLYFTNLEKFNTKWGFDLYKSTVVRNDIISNMNNNYVDPINVLDIGCSCGATLLQIKNLYKNSNLYGIEKSAKMGEICSCFSQITIGDVENIQLNYKEKFFDYIILGDVLDQLNNPWDMLNKIKKYLKEDGLVIASIPNITHISIIKDIICINFPYSSTGIIEKSQLRFFALNDIVKMFQNSNYEMINISALSRELSKDETALINILNSIINHDNTLQYSAYKYIICAK